MIKIKNVHARQILDSRGNPTVEVDVLLSDGTVGTAAVPSGASTGVHEALELRDGDNRYYNGKGVLKAISNVNDSISGKIVGMSPLDQGEIDSAMLELDGTASKSNLGANAILGVSLAVAHAVSSSLKTSLYDHISGGNPGVLPMPLFNILNGGKHAEGSVDFQEFMVVPVGATSFSEAIHIGAAVYHTLGKNLANKGQLTTVGDEGGFAPLLSRNEEALEVVSQAIETAGYNLGDDVAIALDPAVSELYENGSYILSREGCKLSSEELIGLWEDWCVRYPIVSIEDGMAEDDWDGWSLLTKRIGDKVQLVGDDLFVTNVDRIRRGQEEGAGNAVLIKPNQIGSLSETISAIKAAVSGDFTCVMSHRSGETEDTTIADLAVALGTGQIKTGAPARSERVAKYNRLLRIEEYLGRDAQYGGMSVFPFN